MLVSALQQYKQKSLFLFEGSTWCSQVLLTPGSALRTYIWQAQRYGMSGIKSESTACKANDTCCAITPAQWDLIFFLCLICYMLWHTINFRHLTNLKLNRHFFIVAPCNIFFFQFIVWVGGILMRGILPSSAQPGSLTSDPPTTKVIQFEGLKMQHFSTPRVCHPAWNQI